MSSRIREHIRNNVYGLVAIFIALGGTAYAVDGPNPGTNTIGSDDIIGGEVKSSDIANGLVSNIDLKEDTIESGKIKDATITGADVDEATLSFDCPAPFQPAGDTCYLAINPTDANHETVRNLCLANNLRLPTVGETRMIQKVLGPPVGATYGLWTDNYTSGSTAILVQQTPAGSIQDVDTNLTSVVGRDQTCVLSPIRP